MMKYSELKNYINLETSYTPTDENSTDEILLIEKAYFTDFIDKYKYLYIECYNPENLYNPLITYLIAIDITYNVSHLSITTYDSGIPYRKGIFYFKTDKVIYNKYVFLENSKDNDDNMDLVEKISIEMPDVYLSMIEPVSYRNLILNHFPLSGIRRCDGFFIKVKDMDIVYKRTNTELYFDGEEDIEIGIGSFNCTKRRILYSLNNRLTMETFFNDHSSICMSYTKKIERAEENSDFVYYEISERLENVNKLPRNIVISEQITEPTGLDRIKMGKHSYFDNQGKLFAVESWVRDDIYSENKYRIHTLHNLNNKAILNIKLKQDTSSLNKYSEFIINETFPPIITDIGKGRYWFYNNRIFFNYQNKSHEYKMLSYTTEGYYVFYPLAGLSDLIITKREFPLHTPVKSYSIRISFRNTERFKSFKPKLGIQELTYDGEEYIEILGEKKYAMKLSIKDHYGINYMWFDIENNINLKWVYFDNKSNKQTFKSELTELNI